MKKITLSLALFFLVQIGYSQSLNQYTFSQSNGTYSAISGGTVVGNTATDDERFVDPAQVLGGAATTGVGLPIGFNFVFNGFTYDRFAINANGWISLGSSILTPAVDMTSTSSYTPLSSTNAAIPNAKVARIAPFARDLQAQAGAEIRYQLLGAAPNRVLVVQWKNYAKYLAIGDSMNFQIRLEETTNTIQFVYGTMTNNATDTVADCGLRAAPNTPASNFANRTSTTSWITTNAGSTAADSMFMSQTIAPVSGLTYTWSTPPSCTGTPNPGNTIAPSTSACASVAFTLSLQNAISGSGVTFQWMTSPDGVSYSNATGVSTESTYVASQTVATYYKCLVTCTASGLSTESTPVQVGISPVNTCYCIPTYTTGKTDGDLISNITINGTTLSNNSGTAPTNPSYTYFTGQPNYTANLQAGGTYTVSVSVGTFGNQNISVWIDYNDNGLFETSERVGFTTTSIDANGTATFTISLACNPPLGTHRMRVRDVWNQTGNTIDPCVNYNYGEAEDYDVVITSPVACPQPSSVQVTTISTTTATVAWNPGCTETSWLLNVVPAGSPAPIPGSGTVVNSIPYVITGLNQNTDYDIYISADCGLNGTSNFTGPINFRTLIPPPANDDCTSAVALSVGELFGTFPVTGTNVSATNSNPPAPGCGGFSGGDVWYTVTVPASGNITIETSSVTGSNVTDTALAVYSGDCNTLTLLGCDDDSSSNGNFSLITLNGLNPGQVLYVNVWEYLNDAFGTFQIAAYDCASFTPAPAGDADQFFCGTGLTFDAIIVNGSGVIWYPTATGGTAFNNADLIVDGTTYYASQTLDCESFERLAVTVHIDTEPVVSSADLLICDGSGANQFEFDLTAAESMIAAQGNLTYTYYNSYLDADSLTGEIVNATNYMGTNGEVIYVRVQNATGCYAIAELTLAIAAPSAAPTGNSTQDYCTSATLNDLVVNGVNILWYASATGGTPLDPFADLVDGATYFASQNDLGCESTIRLAVTVNDTCANVGCLTASWGEFPSELFTPSCTGSAQVITGAGYAGEYSSVQVTAGVQYTFTSSIPTDFITIGNEDGSIAFTAGSTPLVWTPTTTGIVRFYTHADDACTENTDFRTRSVNCGTPPPAPVNDNCANPIMLTVGGVYSDNAIDSTNAGATLSGETPIPSCGNVNFASVGKDVWYTFVVPNSGNATVETAGTSTGGSGIDSVVQAYTGSCGTLTAVGCDDDGATEVAIGHSRLVLSGLTPGATVYVRVFGYNGGQGNFGISVYDASLGNQELVDFSFTAYPNPVKDQLTISSTEALETLEVFNMVGQLVMSKSINATETSIDFSTLPTGSYLVRTTVNGQVKTLKVIKQ